MIRPIDLPVVLSQTPLAQQLQFAAQNAPGAHQAFLSQLVIQKQQREMEQVAKTEKTQAFNNSVKDREGQGGDLQQEADRNNDAEQDQETFEHSEHIVDIKV
ncbi:hypothetical protein [Desulfonatronovibrio hydrogenovorans]|uniref:hypothetical protein n=1 Tax=Desulfonatronovibrio hydrogenovorans TaxID=53245 RepID=UPI00048BFE65|nr:hypothetical protein [Desulfonatronovibrio hydrogenovorans]